MFHLTFSSCFLSHIVSSHTSTLRYLIILHISHNLLGAFYFTSLSIISSPIAIMPSESLHPPIDIPNIDIWGFLFERKDIKFPEDRGALPLLPHGDFCIARS